MTNKFKLTLKLIQIMHIQTVFTFIKNNHEYIPLVSSATSFYKIFHFAIDCPKSHFPKTYHFTLLKKTSLLRNVVLLIPVVGNIVIGLYDLKKQSEKSFTLNAVIEDGLALEHASKENRDCLGVVLEAIKQNKKALKFASSRIREDESFIEEKLKEGIISFRFAGDKIKSNESFVLKMMAVYGCSFLKEISESLLESEAFMEKAMKIDPSALKLSKVLRSDENFVFRMFYLDEHILKYASKGLRSNSFFVGRLMDGNVLALEDAEDSVKSDSLFIKERMHLNMQAFTFSNLKNDRDFILARVEENLAFVQVLPHEYRSDKQFLSLFKQENFKVMQYAADVLRDDLSYNIECIEYGLSLKWVTNAFKSNEELVFIFIQKKMFDELAYANEDIVKSYELLKRCARCGISPYVMRHFHESLGKNPEFMLELIVMDELFFCFTDTSLSSSQKFGLKAIEKNHKAMMYSQYKYDHSFIADAIKINIKSFKYALPFSQKNPGFVLAWMDINRAVLQCADKTIRNSYEFFLEILPSDISLFEFAGDTLGNDLEFIRKYILKDTGLLGMSTNGVLKNAEIVRYAKESVRNNTIFLIELMKYGINPYLYASDSAAKELKLQNK